MESQRGLEDLLRSVWDANLQGCQRNQPTQLHHLPGNFHTFYLEAGQRALNFADNSSCAATRFLCNVILLKIPLQGVPALFLFQAPVWRHVPVVSRSVSHSALSVELSLVLVSMSPRRPPPTSPSRGQISGHFRLHIHRSFLRDVSLSTNLQLAFREEFLCLWGNKGGFAFERAGSARGGCVRSLGAALRCTAVICCQIIDIIQSACAGAASEESCLPRITEDVLKIEFWERQKKGAAPGGDGCLSAGCWWSCRPQKDSSVVLLALFAPPAPRPVGDIDLLTEAAFSEMHFFKRAPQILKSLERAARTVGLMLSLPTNSREKVCFSASHHTVGL